MTNSQKLKGAMVASGYTQKKIAKYLGISLQSVSKKINNKTEFKASEINKLIELLKIGNVCEIFFTHCVENSATNH